MFESLNNLIKHMQEEHPDAECFGDSCYFDVTNKVISQKCFICGKELVNKKEEENDKCYTNNGKRNRRGCPTGLRT